MGWLESLIDPLDSDGLLFDTEMLIVTTRDTPADQFKVQGMAVREKEEWIATDVVKPLSQSMALWMGNMLTYCLNCGSLTHCYAAQLMICEPSVSI